MLPTLGYVLVVGVFGVAAKYGLRQVTWQGLVALTTAGYALVLALLLLKGLPFRAPGRHAGSAVEWAMVVVAALIPAVSIVLFFVAIGRGPVTRVVPVGAIYPLVTLVVGVAFLSERVTWQAGVGVLLVVAGAMLLSL